MPPQPLPPADRARLLQVAIGSGFAFAILERYAGVQIAELLQRSPFTFAGWVVVGWLVGGPTYLLSALLWNGGGRLSQSRRLRSSILLGLAVGLGMFLLPVALPGSPIGTSDVVGRPLAQGWLWGATATLAMTVYGTAVVRVLGRSAPGGGTAAQRAMTARYLEISWVVVLIVTLAAALSGETGGLLTDFLSPSNVSSSGSFAAV